MNKRIYGYNKRKGDIRNKKKQRNNGEEDDSDKNESEGIIYNKMNTYNKRKVKEY